MRKKSWMIVAVLLAASLMTYAQQAGGASKLQRDIANLQADLDAVRQDERVLIGRIAELEQENQRKDAQIENMQKLLSAMEQRLREFEKSFTKSLEAEREARNKQLTQFGKVVTSELEQRGRAQTPTYTGKYKEFTVEKGDNLSTIAKACGVTVAELKAANNLKNDNIYVGQVLKIPVK